MRAKTTHVIPVDGGWTVKQQSPGEPRMAGTLGYMAPEQLRAKPSAARSIKTYATQKEAIVAARELVKRGTSGRIVVHGRDGSIRSKEVRGLPAVQTPPIKGNLGTKAIEKAVSAVIRERLALNSRS